MMKRRKESYREEVDYGVTSLKEKKRHIDHQLDCLISSSFIFLGMTQYVRNNIRKVEEGRVIGKGFTEKTDERRRDIAWYYMRVMVRWMKS